MKFALVAAAAVVALVCGVAGGTGGTVVSGGGGESKKILAIGLPNDHSQMNNMVDNDKMLRLIDQLYCSFNFDKLRQFLFPKVKDSNIESVIVKSMNGYHDLAAKTYMMLAVVKIILQKIAKEELSMRSPFEIDLTTKPIKRQLTQAAQAYEREKEIRDMENMAYHGAMGGAHVLMSLVESWLPNSEYVHIIERAFPDKSTRDLDIKKTIANFNNISNVLYKLISGSSGVYEALFRVSTGKPQRCETGESPAKADRNQEDYPNCPKPEWFKFAYSYFDSHNYCWVRRSMPNPFVELSPFATSSNDTKLWKLLNEKFLNRE